MHKYPCKDCLIVSICKTLSPVMCKNLDYISTFEILNYIKIKTCIYCGGNTIINRHLSHNDLYKVLCDTCMKKPLWFINERDLYNNDIKVKDN